MWNYEKRLQYPVKITQTNPKIAQIILTQFGGPDGELAASMRYLAQRYTMPYKEVTGILTDIGTEELAHLEIICAIVHQLTRNLTPEQIEKEFKGVLDLIMDVYKDFGFKNYKCRLSLRDPEDKEKYFQDDEMWNNAEDALRKVLNDIGIDYIEAKGEAAFYGPKLDILIKPAIGNEVALSTIQLDFLLPRRFELYYIDANGEKKTPVVIHRAILGSLDRFIAMLLEETKGALPLWLAPVGINVIPVNKEYHLEYATSIYEMLKDANYRVELDDSDEKLSYKMRESQIRKIPITLILGQKEVDEKTISFRLFGSTETTTMSIEEFKKYIENLIVNKK